MNSNHSLVVDVHVNAIEAEKNTETYKIGVNNINILSAINLINLKMSRSQRIRMIIVVNLCKKISKQIVS